MYHKAWVVLLFVLALALAACGGESEPESPQATVPPTSPPQDAGAPVQPPSAPDSVGAADASATEEPAPDEALADFNVYTPGMHAREGLTILRSTEYAENPTGAFFAEIRNDTGEFLRSVDGSMDLLDAENLRLGTVPLYILLSDIPPGESFFVGETFPLPAGYTASAIWLDYTAADAPALDAFFNLPVTIETHGPGETHPYMVSGAVENNTGQELVLWVLTLAALDADDQIVGLAHALVTPDTPNGNWPTGTNAPFEATFTALAGDASAVTSVTASAVGYALLD